MHNTQPWVFWVRADGRLELRAMVSGPAEPDLLGTDRRLLAADPLSRELAISCGAALFNLRLAFRVMGHDVAVWLIPADLYDSSLLASIEIVTGRTHRPTVKEQKLYSAIPQRHTNRSPITDRTIPPTVQAAMKRAESEVTRRCGTMVLRVGYATRPAVFTPRRSAPDILDLRTKPPRRVLSPAPDKAPRTAALPAAN